MYFHILMILKIFLRNISLLLSFDVFVWVGIRVVLTSYNMLGSAPFFVLGESLWKMGFNYSSLNVW